MEFIESVSNCSQFFDAVRFAFDQSETELEVINLLQHYSNKLGETEFFDDLNRGSVHRLFELVDEKVSIYGMDKPILLEKLKTQIISLYKELKRQSLILGIENCALSNKIDSNKSNHGGIKRYISKAINPLTSLLFGGVYIYCCGEKGIIRNGVINEESKNINFETVEQFSSWSISKHSNQEFVPTAIIFTHRKSGEDLCYWRLKQKMKNAAPKLKQIEKYLSKV